MAGVDSLLAFWAIATLGPKAGDGGLYFWQLYLHLLMGSFVLKKSTTARASLQGHFYGLVDALLWWFLPIVGPALAGATARGFWVCLGLISGEGGSLAVAAAQLGFQGCVLRGCF
jgi:hypothetical protein